MNIKPPFWLNYRVERLPVSKKLVKKISIDFFYYLDTFMYTILNYHTKPSFYHLLILLFDKIGVFILFISSNFLFLFSGKLVGTSGKLNASISFNISSFSAYIDR